MFTLLQVDNDLKSINSTGALSAALTLPSGITLSNNRIPRFTRFKGQIIVVNTPSRPIQVDESGNVTPLTPNAPGTAVALTSTSTGLTGTYRALQTYVIKDALGNVIAESDYSPLMASAVTIANKKLVATYAASSETDVPLIGTRLYRTTTNGATYFPWIDDMTNGTSITDATADASLGAVAAADRGTAPDLTLIAEWAGRLWGVDRDDVDDLRYTEAGTAFGWSALNTIRIPHFGEDSVGLTALIPRRNALGVARLGVFTQITGSSRTNFTPTVVNGGENMGCVSQGSVIVFKDVAYFLWRDGVYKWDNDGITCVSDGAGVRSWFATDDYFNRALYWRSFAQLDPVTLKYRLFLASVGSTHIDRWVELDLITGKWWGPHLTTAFTPSCAVLVAGSNQKPYFMIGSREGHLSQDSDTKNDWGVSPIALSVKTNDNVAGSPDQETYYGELTVFTEKNTGTLTVTPYLGDVGDTDATTPFSMDMSRGRHRLGRVGTGVSMQMQFDHATIDQDVVILGYTIDPVLPVGRR